MIFVEWSSAGTGYPKGVGWTLASLVEGVLLYFFYKVEDMMAFGKLVLFFVIYFKKE
jgi:hypothetical protein